MTDAVLEKLAEKLALAFNGGAWRVHYTEAQRDLWRQRAQTILDAWRKP